MNLRSTNSMNSETSHPITNSFKNTEVGRIPNDWEVVSLKDVANFGGGTTPPRKSFEKYYVSGVHPWVKTLDLNNGYISSTEENVTEAALAETSLKMHPVGTVLVAMYGGFNQIGRTGLIKVNASINQALVAVITKKERLVPTYLLNYFNYKVDHWKTVASSSRKDPNITSNDVKSFLLPLPGVTEQTAIANALSDVDALILELEKLISKKQAIKTATMQQLLTGRTRLPQFAHHPDGRKKGYKPSELGEIPEDWELMPLGELTEVIRNGSNYKTIFKDGVPVTRIETIAKGFIDFDRTGIASEESIHPSYKLKDGDILYSHINSVDHIGKVAMFEGDRPLYHGINLLLIRVDHNTSSNWLYSYLSFFPSREWAKKIAKQAVSQASINTKELKQLVIPTPMFDEQEAIGLALKEFDHELDLCKLRLDKTHQIKQGMMQELLTGKTRLKS